MCICLFSIDRRHDLVERILNDGTIIGTTTEETTAAPPRAPSPLKKKASRKVIIVFFSGRDNVISRVVLAVGLRVFFLLSDDGVVVVAQLGRRTFVYFNFWGAESSPRGG